MSRLIVAIALALAAGLACCPKRQPSRPSESTPIQRAPPRAQGASTGIKPAVPQSFVNELGMRFVPVLIHPEGTPDSQSRVAPPYYVLMQSTEVTNAQFRAWRPGNNSDREGGFLFHTLNRDEQPVVLVSPRDAVGFAEWLGTQDRAHSYRLPTVAEWEQACRGTERSAWPWELGQSPPLDGRANLFDQSAYDELHRYSERPEWGPDGFVASAPVGTYPPNELGLHDLVGNVWEICSPFATGEGASRSDDSYLQRFPLRGGSWYSRRHNLEEQQRALDADVHDVDAGFRLVAVPVLPAVAK